MDRAQVRNAGDPQQVKRAARKEREAAELERAATVQVMATPAGRLFVWALLSRSRIYESVFHPSANQIYYLAGRQDFGHELLALVIDSDDQAYQLMEAEARARTRRENAATDAAHTTSSTQGDSTDGR